MKKSMFAKLIIFVILISICLSCTNQKQKEETINWQKTSQITLHQEEVFK